MFFGKNLCLFIALIYDKNDHKFMGNLYSCFFFRIIKNYMFFAINLCIFIALIYDKKRS